MEVAAECVNVCGCESQVFDAIHVEPGLDGLGHPPTLGEPELGEQGAGGRNANILDKVLPQDSQCFGVKNQRAPSSKTNQATAGVEFENLLVVELFCAHVGSSKSFNMK
jgi:hypothetical protein